MCFRVFCTSWRKRVSQILKKSRKENWNHSAVASRTERERNSVYEQNSTNQARSCPTRLENKNEKVSKFTRLGENPPD